jgi:hypothetical protein
VYRTGLGFSAVLNFGTGCAEPLLLKYQLKISENYTTSIKVIFLENG